MKLVTALILLMVLICIADTVWNWRECRQVGHGRLYCISEITR